MNVGVGILGGWVVVLVNFYLVKEMGYIGVGKDIFVKVVQGIYYDEDGQRNMFVGLCRTIIMTRKKEFVNNGFRDNKVYADPLFW